MSAESPRFKTISADSHITEPPDCYIDRIEAKYRDTAPRIEVHETRGDVFVIDGLKEIVPMGLVAAAGKDPKDLRFGGVKFGDLHRGGWDSKCRLADQDKDGVSAEVIYPTVGMLLCNHPDYAYKTACFQAYNRWLQEYCAEAPDRLIGIGQTAMESVDAGIRDLHVIKEMGFKGVMFPGRPQEADYDDPMYDPVWQTAIDLDLPISFHILTSGDDTLNKYRGARINAFQTIIRGNQDIIGMLIYGGVFDRHPLLKIVCVEADAGWVPHYMYRMDHAFKRHRYWLKAPPLERLPSDYFKENIYLTFQDDWSAFMVHRLCNVERLMWANDFPHSDSTWPWSQEMLAEHTATLSDWERSRILHDNVAELYKLQ